MDTKGPGQLRLRPRRLNFRLNMSISTLLAPQYKGGIPPSYSSSLKALPASRGSSTCPSDCLLPPLSSGRISSPSFPEIVSLYPQELLSFRNKPFLISCVADCSPPGSSVHGISQARILEWVAISYSRESFQPRDRTQVSCIPDGFFTTEPPAKPVAHQ